MKTYCSWHREKYPNFIWINSGQVTAFQEQATGVPTDSFLFKILFWILCAMKFPAQEEHRKLNKLERN